MARLQYNMLVNTNTVVECTLLNFIFSSSTQILYFHCYATELHRKGSGPKLPQLRVKVTLSRHHVMLEIVPAFQRVELVHVTLVVL